MNQLIISNLSKTYSNGVCALDDISLTIPTGMFGLLGPNGAGKSTLMRTLVTLQEPDKGEIQFRGIDVLREKEKIRSQIGYLPQNFGLYPRISASVLLNHLAVLKGITNKKERQELVDLLLEKTNLYQDRHKNLGGFSGGMKQRFGIAQALLANPKLLIVDEPTAGLDPTERNRFHHLLCSLGETATIILSTHIVEDIKELCSNMAIIQNGKVLLQGKPLHLIDQLKGYIYKKRIHQSEVESYKKNYQVIAEKLLQGKPEIHIYSTENTDNGFVSTPATLEDVYFKTCSQLTH